MRDLNLWLPAAFFLCDLFNTFNFGTLFLVLWEQQQKKRKKEEGTSSNFLKIKCGAVV